MNIGVDIDGVLTDVERAIINYGTKMCVEENWQINIDVSKYNTNEAFQWTKEQENKFWKKYIEKYFTETEPREFIAEITKKIQHCIENNIDIMIEDNPKNIEDISSKIKVIKFDCQYNKDITNENVITAYSWYHIYKIIREMKGE